MNEVRRLTSGDEPLIECMQLTFYSDDWQQLNENFLGDPRNYLYYAYSDGEIGGWLLGYRLDRPDTLIPMFFLYEIEVLEQFQRHGLGSILLEAFKEAALAAGGDNYFVLTNSSNLPAMGLYASAGGVSHDSDVVMFDFDLR